MAEKKIKNELDTDYRLLGIATSLKEYKLCHFLNQLLDCDFKKLEALSFELKDRGRKVEFSVFRAEQEESNNTFTVFTNKNMGEFLLHEVSNFDFIVQVSGKFDDDDMRALAEGVKQMPEVLMSAEIPLRKIKSKERLVYVVERPAPVRFKNSMRRL